jgi:hypothetical protein
VTHLVYWDEKAMYFEQKFVSLKDEQVYAFAIIRSSVIGGSVTEMMRMLGSLDPPKIPENVETWQKSQQVSSIGLHEDRAKVDGRKIE